MALTEEIRGIVNSAIEGLPEELKTAIVLRELDGLSYEEIAAAMECPVGTVRSRIFRAREAIDKRLREVFEGGLGRTEEMVDEAERGRRRDSQLSAMFDGELPDGRMRIARTPPDARRRVACPVVALFR